MLTHEYDEYAEQKDVIDHGHVTTNLLKEHSMPDKGRILKTQIQVLISQSCMLALEYVQNTLVQDRQEKEVHECSSRVLTCLNGWKSQDAA